MLKILFYSFREDEKPALVAWQKANKDVEVVTTTELLTPETAKKAAGFNGVVTFQQLDYTRKTLEALAHCGVKNMSLRNVGLDNIDVAAVEEFGINVSNVPAYSPNAIAEHSVIQLTRLLRHTNEYDARVAKRDLRWAPFIGKELRMQIVGVIGTGKIGQIAIKIFQGFGAKVIAFDPFRNADIDKQGLYVNSLNELYAQADIVTLYAPGLPSNNHMINMDAINHMKDGVFIINVSRGNLMDTDALITGLDSGKVAGAAIDVYEDEVGLFNEDWSGKEFPDPRLENLLKRQNVLVTPHIAFYTETAVGQMVEISLDANKKFILGGIPDVVANFGPSAPTSMPRTPSLRIISPKTNPSSSSKSIDSDVEEYVKELAVRHQSELKEGVEKLRSKYNEVAKEFETEFKAKRGRKPSSSEVCLFFRAAKIMSDSTK